MLKTIGFGRGFCRPARIWSVVLLAVVLWACPYVTFRHVTRDPTYRGEPEKILIHVVDRNPVVSSSHATVGGMFEDRLVEQLEERGVSAVAGYKYLPDKMVISREELDKLIEQKGADAVFMAGPTTRKDFESLRPGEFSYAAGLLEGRIEDIDSFTAFVTGSVNSTGSYAGKKVLMELVLYDVKRNRRIWSALTETYIWDMPANAVKPLVGRILEKLSEERILF